MRVVVESGRRINDSDGIKPADDLGIDIFHIRAVKLNHLGHLAADRIDGIQRGGGFLKDVGDLAPAHLAEFGIGGCQQISAIKRDAS